MENQRAGRPARIVAKMNQLEDPEIIAALCDAGCAGVPVDLVIRGLCCLRPGIPGRSDGIRVRSIIGRFLEHSRIFHFTAGHEDPLDGEFYMGSADWMFRNLSRRVEVVTPVTALGAKERLWEIRDLCLRDPRQAWLLTSDGRYAQVHSEPTREESDKPRQNSRYVYGWLSRPYADTPDRYFESPPQTSLFGALGSRPTITPHPHCYSGVFGATMPTFVFAPPMRTRQNSVLVTTRCYLLEVHSPAVYYPSI